MFISWVLSRFQIKEKPTKPDGPSALSVIEDKYSKFKKIPKWTRARRSGKDIYCPNCHHKIRVYNFAWSALSCQACGATNEKYSWLIENNS